MRLAHEIPALTYLFHFPTTETLTWKKYIYIYICIYIYIWEIYICIDRYEKSVSVRVTLINHRANSYQYYCFSKKTQIYICILFLHDWYCNLTMQQNHIRKQKHQWGVYCCYCFRSVSSNGIGFGGRRSRKVDERPENLGFWEFPGSVGGAAGRV